MKYSFIFLFLLIGCAGVSEKQKQQATDQYNSELAKCDSIKTSYTDYIVCFNEATTRFFNNVDFEYPEVIAVSNAYHLALAERVDARQITPEQAEIAYRQLRVELASEAIQRNRAAMQQRLEWRELIRSLNTRYIYNNPVTCFQTGNMITCN